MLNSLCVAVTSGFILTAYSIAGRVLGHCTISYCFSFIEVRKHMDTNKYCYFVLTKICILSAGAMRALNGKGIVHRDMKPQNILLCFPLGSKNPPASQINLKIGKFIFTEVIGDCRKSLNTIKLVTNILFMSKNIENSI